MRDVAASLAEPGDRNEALGRITLAAVQTVQRVVFGSLSVRHLDGSLETIAATSPLIDKADQVQYQLREGPCYDAVTNGPVAYSADLSTDQRWPRFGPRAAALGLTSQMAIRLADDAGTATGLNLYSGARDGLTGSHDLALLFASHAALAFGFADQLQGLRRALETRGTIGTAIGIVMERYEITDERAFELLIRVSQNINMKLRDVAADIVADTNRENLGR